MTFSRGGIIATIAVVIVVLVCARLGFWQLDRLEQKQQRNAAAHMRAAEPPVRLSAASRDTAGMIFRHAIVTGPFDDERTIIIAGRSSQGVPGVYVLTPVRVGESGFLVNRGFVPSADAAHIDLDPLREAYADSLEGLIVYLGHDENAVKSADSTFKRVWYRPAIAQLRAQVPYPIADYVVQLLPADGAPASPVRLPAPELDEGPHLGYAIQWFSFALIFMIGWAVIVFRRAIVVVVMLFAAPTYAVAQLRPLDPVDFQSFAGKPVRIQAGVARYSGQHASLAGTRGTLWEAGNFAATIRTGRMVMELGGTIQRFFEDSDTVATPTGDASPPPADGRRHDSGDYRVAAVVRLTPDNSTTLAALRFGTRLPTTDNRVGLDRDAIDFYTTVSAFRDFAAATLAVEAGLSINGTREPAFEQSDVLSYAITGEWKAGAATPFIMVLGQHAFHDTVIRGNENLSELRAGARAGSERWISATWVHGLTEFSPRNGLQLSLGISFGGP